MDIVQEFMKKIENNISKAEDNLMKIKCVRKKYNEINQKAG